MQNDSSRPVDSPHIPVETAPTGLAHTKVDPYQDPDYRPSTPLEQTSQVPPASYPEDPWNSEDIDLDDSMIGEDPVPTGPQHPCLSGETIRHNG